uniref:Uncharacterized protein n=1 Tax=Trichogramma kaykai TaxID=54128 RepID=A0ABD2WQR1_9HYME
MKRLFFSRRDERSSYDDASCCYGFSLLLLLLLLQAQSAKALEFVYFGMRAWYTSGVFGLFPCTNCRRTIEQQQGWASVDCAPERRIVNTFLFFFLLLFFSVISIALRLFSCRTASRHRENDSLSLLLLLLLPL